MDSNMADTNGDISEKENNNETPKQESSELTNNSQNQLEGGQILSEESEVNATPHIQSEENSGVEPVNHQLDVHQPREMYFLPRNDWPDSYRNHSYEEQQLFELIDRFITQYRRLFPDRKPLFITPNNDCHVPKLACSYIRPTLLPYAECYDWQGCAAFVADHLQHRPLDDSTEIPSMMHAPAEVLRFQSANVFEFSTVLCSFLRGAGYNAYVVSGYAVRPVCGNDTIRIVCNDEINSELNLTQPPTRSDGNGDASDHKKEDYDSEDTKTSVDCESVTAKYASLYENMMHEREEEAMQRLQQAEEEERFEQTKQHEQEPSDPLFGRRLHSWVLVLPGARQVVEPFFIEPSLGWRRSIRTADYLGIESLWNDTNYWINMQSCANGVRNLIYDLYNAKHWEYLLLRPAMLTPHPQQTPAMFSEDVHEAASLLAMPPTWTEPMVIERPRFHQRYPSGYKTIYFYRQRVDKYAMYALQSGLIKKVTYYGDFECTQAVSISEYFANRTDYLRSRLLEIGSGSTVENFDLGRSDKLKCHHYNMKTNQPHDKRTFEYYHQGRLHGLSTRSINGQGRIEELFINRPNKVIKRTIILDMARKHETSSYDRRYIKEIRERFNRENQSIEESHQTTKCNFNIEKGNITIEYIPKELKDKIERRQFDKPALSDHENLIETLRSAAATNLNDIDSRPPHLLTMLHIYRELTAAEQVAITEAIEAQAETAAVVAECYRRYEQQLQNDEEQCWRQKQQQHQERAIEDTQQKSEHTEILEKKEKPNGDTVNINYQLYDSYLNENVRAERQRLAQHEQAEKQRMLAESRDPLAEQLRHLDRPLDQLTSTELGQIRHHCLLNCRNRLVSRTTRMQQKYDETAVELEALQLQQKEKYSGSGREVPRSTEAVSDDQQQEYVDKCEVLSMRMQMLQELMESHKHTSKLRYEALRKQLKADSRLAQADPESDEELNY